MEQLVERIRSGLSAGLYPSERAVSTSIVVPVLRTLGWDDSDPSQVMPEYANPRGRVDFALSAKPNSPAVFVEVKRVGQSADADRQLFEYAFHEGAQIAVLTDGRLWNFYLPGQHGSYEERRVYQLDLVERDTEESIRRFTRYLSRARVSSGEALSDAQSDYRASASRREAESTMPKAWSMLLDEPDGLIIELLRERTEGLCGHKPSDAALESFLRAQVASDYRSPSPVVPRVMRTEAVAFPSVQSVEQRGKVNSSPVRNSWRLREKGGQERNGNDALTAFLTALFEAYPAKQETIAAAVRTRGRNNISRNVAELYPNRPELGIRFHRALPGGWFVGTNESSATKARIVLRAAAAVGLKIGQDFDFDVNPEA